MKIDLELKWRIGDEPGNHVDPVLFQLLDGIRDSGTLRAAASAAGVSYRHAWGLLERWEGIFGQPLATLSRGRGAKLTALGEKLLWAQSRVAAKLGPELENLGSEIRTGLDSLLATEVPPALRIFASHGLALSLLKRLAGEQGELKLDLQFRGSLECLRLLKANRCDIAGFHMASGEIGEQLKPRFRPWLSADQQTLIQVVGRQQGLMLPRDNPKQIRSTADLARSDVTVINRQPGSGTRLLFDQLLANAGIVAEQVHGYETEEFTHMAVAALVASGSADAGFGIAAAAEEMHLEFLPLVRENYYFCLAQSLLAGEAVQSLLALLKSWAFRDPVNRLAGYDAGRAGEIVSIAGLVDE